MPSTAWLGTDLLALRPDVQTVRDPYSGETLCLPLYRATWLDPCPGHRPYSNARLNKNLGIDQADGGRRQ